ncbi:uncharacterized protein AMSG_00650 [Thecamonas trahens ATCC 50062]|uniref:Uncharacterized protein n=1 Tax=Thecamonas trahens ATCC 50062 TaxID=461836 RepID=A0A0L0DDS2_THETB|nr:hypothetical protein AMSG_00650 [Thecamonas trahens ATCC 50062]KNC50487.1 hypothetical protein AMSG_00650 [Thecamonas trahens ATCC 50062]|eukprot:XP_013762383.1 hypothetical protein AMSG_00650 [Thecamonas trahens ATCC 50062]
MLEGETGNAHAYTVAVGVVVVALLASLAGGPVHAPFEPCSVYAAAAPAVPRNIPQHITTLVTSYIALENAKHSIEEYREWMETMVCIASPLVVFADAASAEVIRGIREDCLDGADIVVNVVDGFADLYTAQWQEQLHAQAHEDPEAKIGHSAELYMIWNEKTAWLDEVARKNPFGTQYFAWIDIGYFRGPEYHTERAAFYKVAWPAASRTQVFDAGRVLVLGVAPVVPGSAECADADAVYGSFSKRGVGGGFIGGTAAAIARWRKAYYELMGRFLGEGRFVGKDQVTMAAVACWQPDVVEVVPACGGDWFYMASYLRELRLQG